LRHRIVLARISEDGALAAVGTLEGLAQAEDNFVEVFLDSSRLTPARYQLSLSGDAGTSGANQVSVFRLRLTAATPATQPAR